MPRVFLNYRREDSAGIAGRLFDRLCVELGRENVFRDLDTLVPGADFAKVIADQVASCDALIAVIGNDWLTARDADGHRRLDQPGDLVKAEIREALGLDKLVIPALVEGASIPNAPDLPPDIAALAARNAIEISDSRFAYDTERLIRAVQTHTDGASDPRSPPAKQRLWWAWVSGPNHQRRLGFIGAGITATAIAGWSYVHFSDVCSFSRSRHEILTAARNLKAAKQEEETLGEEMQKARKNLDNALPSDKPGLQEVASAIDQKLREAKERVGVAEDELFWAEDGLEDAELCLGIATDDGEG